ncbi:MAG: hypothetical protein U9Q30_00670 [Campylobacterota bacterium]|nr:hypothetical protein [Campylobacterota bacterium]
MKTIIFGIIFSAVFALLTLYIIKRFINKLDIKDNYKKYFKYFLYINYIGVVAYMYTRYNPNIPNILFFLLSLPIGVIFLTFSISIIYDIKYTLLKKAPLSNNRREVLKKSLDYIAIAGAIGVTL